MVITNPKTTRINGDEEMKEKERKKKRINE